MDFPQSIYYVGNGGIPDQAILAIAANTGVGPSVPSPSVSGLDWLAATDGNVQAHQVGSAATPSLNGIITINKAGVYRITFSGRVLYSVTGDVPAYSITRLQRSVNDGVSFFGFDTDDVAGEALSIPTESTWVSSDYDAGGDGFLTMSHWIEHPFAELDEGDQLRVAGYITDPTFAAMVATIPYGMFRVEYVGAPRAITTSEVTTVSIVAETDDGHIIGQDPDYATARTTPTSVGTSAATLRVGADATFDIRRLGLRFNTSSIPDNATILSMKLKMTPQAVTGAVTHFDVRIQKYNWTSPLAITDPGDYDGMLAATLDAVWSNTAALAAGTPVTSPALDTSRCNKTGYTYFAIVSSRDVAGTQPTGNEFIVLHSATAAVDANKPTLIVQYTI